MELKNYFAQDSQGNILGGATCYLYQPGSETLVTGIQDANGSPLANPFTAAQNGLIQFAAPNGRYDLRVVSGSRDYRIRVQCNDVAGNVLLADLSDTSDPAKGAALVGFKQTGADAVPRTIMDKVREVVSVKDFGAVGDGVADDAPAINAAIEHVYQAGGGFVHIPAGVFALSVQVTVKANVVLCGAGRGATTLILKSYDQVVVVEDYGSLRDVTCDGNNLHIANTIKLAGITVRSYCIVENIETKNNYTGIVLGNYPTSIGSTGSVVRNIHTHNNESRGLQFDPFASYNVATGIHSHDNGNAGIIIGHGSYQNIVSDYLIENINNGSLWLSQGAYRNRVSNGMIRNPVAGQVAINIQLGSYQNVISGVTIINHPRAAQIISGAVDGVYPEVLNSDSFGNVLEGIYAIGTDNTATDNYAVRFQDSDGLYTARDCVVRNCFFDNFYGVFHNVSDAANNCMIGNIRTKNIGAGGIVKGMKANGTDTIKLYNVEGFTSKARWLSDPFAIDSTGTKTIVINHGLPYTPSLTMLYAALYRETVVEDFRLDHVWVVAVTSSAVTVRVIVGQASATAGAVARVVLRMDSEAENGFPVSSLT